MGIPPEQAGRLSLYTYEAMLYHWNDAIGGGGDISPPDPGTVMPMLDRINSDPRLVH